MPPEPATPRPAATVILLRRGGTHGERGVEVLMLERSAEASFMPGVWVFPGGAVDAADAGDDEASHRACAVRELQEEVAIELDPDELRPWSRWITPALVPIRFDTRFYVALSPPHSSPRPDGREAVEIAWFEPARALGLHEAGDMDLVFPTVKHLESLLPYANADEVLEAARERPIEPIEPRVVGEGEARRIVLPGEPGFE